MFTSKLQEAYQLARIASPAVYIAVGWPNLAPIIAALILQALELTVLRRVHTPAVYGHYAVISLMPPPASLIFAVLLIPVLHVAKMADNAADWKAHVLAAAVATFANIQLVPLLAYALGEAVWYYAKFAADKPIVKIGGRLEAVAGRALTYEIEIRVKGPAIAKLPDGRVVHVKNYARETVKIKFDAAGVYKPSLLLTYVSPTRAVKFTRQAAHPPIYVIPRFRAAVEIGERILAGIEPEEVAGAREYVPGDPLRPCTGKNHKGAETRRQGV